MKRFCNLFFFLTASCGLVSLFILPLWYASDREEWMLYAAAGAFFYSVPVFVIVGYRDEMSNWIKKKVAYESKCRKRVA